MNLLKFSNTHRSSYEKACKDSDRKILAPVLDVPTRWNSMYAMLYHALQMRAVSFVLSNNIQLQYDCLWSLLDKVLDDLCNSDPKLEKHRIGPSKWQEVHQLLHFF